MRRETFLAGMAQLGTAFDKVVTEPLTDLYWEEFGGLDDETFRLVVRVAIRALTFFPKVAELHQQLRAVQAARGGPPLPEEAFGLFVAKLRGYSVDLAAATGADTEAARCGFATAELAAARDCGGLGTLATMPERDLHFARAKWLAAYERAAQRADLPAALPAPADAIEATFGPPAPPRRLGGGA